MGYRDIAVEAVDVIEALCDFTARSLAGHRIPQKEAAAAFSVMIAAPRRLRRLLEQEDRVAEFMREVDE